MVRDSKAWHLELSYQKLHGSNWKKTCNTCKTDSRIPWCSVPLTCNWVTTTYVGKPPYCLYRVNSLKSASELKRSRSTAAFLRARVNILNINYFKIATIAKRFFWKDWLYLEVFALYTNSSEYIVNSFSSPAKLKRISRAIFWSSNTVYLPIFPLKPEIFAFL